MRSGRGGRPYGTVVLVISLRRRHAAWLSLVAVLLGVGVVPALHRMVHELEEHEDEHDAAPRRTAPQRRAGHAERHGHADAHRHVGAGRHTRARVATEEQAPRPRHHHHQHHHPGDDRDPVQHGRGAPEHVGAALIAAATPVIPPSPTPTLGPSPPAPLAGCLPREASRPSTIRGPPSPTLFLDA